MRYNSWARKSGIEEKKAFSKFAEFTYQKSRFFYVLDSLQLLMFTDSISLLLNNIKDRLVEHNTLLQSQDYHVFTFRSPEINAYSLGEGAILLSTGLLERLTTIDQIAFVIAHELSHDLLNHNFNNAKRYCEELYDDEFRKSLQQARRNVAGRKTATRNLMNSFFAMHMHYSRYHEFQADSLGYVLLSNAQFSNSGPREALQVLDDADRPLYLDTIDFKSHFDFAEYPFKSYWLTAETAMLTWDSDTLLYQIPDSMKSHPDCALRLARVDSLQQAEHIYTAPDEKTLEHFSQVADFIPFEVLESVVLYKDYAVGLFLSLQLLKRWPSNIYLKCVATHCLFELADAMSKQKYLEYVEFPNREYSKGYNHVLIFLHNMNSTSLRKLSHHYLQTHLADITGNPYVDYLKILDALQDTPLTIAQVQKYEAVHTETYFTELLRSRLPPAKSKK